MLSPEELLLPRRKVQNMWPDMGPQGYFDGQIITLTGESNGQRFAVINTNHVYDAFFEAFPHLFKKLEWWEGRKPEDMPEYVKWDYQKGIDNTEMKGFVSRATRWIDGHQVVTESGTITSSSCWLPATEAEYLTYKNKNNG